MSQPGEHKSAGQLLYEVVAGVMQEVDQLEGVDRRYTAWGGMPNSHHPLFERAARSFIQITGGEGPVVNIHSCGHRLLSLGCKAAHQMAGEPEPRHAPSEG